VIHDRLGDARAHAEAGRVFEANDRIAELRRRLIDDQSGEGSILSNARAAFYRQAFHAEPFDPRIHQELGPEPAGELAARFSQIAGRNQYVDTRLVIEEIGGSLRGLRDSQTIVGDAKGADYWQGQWDAWHKRHAERLTTHMCLTLSDAQMALHSAVGEMRIKPELR
jgi:hypothetical protein